MFTLIVLTVRRGRPQTFKLGKNRIALFAICAITTPS